MANSRDEYKKGYQDCIEDIKEWLDSHFFLRKEYDVNEYEHLVRMLLQNLRENLEIYENKEI